VIFVYIHVCMCVASQSIHCAKIKTQTHRENQRSEDSTHKMAINSLKTDRRQLNAAIGGIHNKNTTQTYSGQSAAMTSQHHFGKYKISFYNRQ
jgi:hypothetical protein